MKIDIYTLLGMIKDNKVPKKILWKDEVFEYDEKWKDYVDNDNDCLFIDYEWQDMLNDEIEILETTITYKLDKVEKIPIKDMKIQATSTNNYCYSISQPMKIIINKINEIIDRLNKDQV